MKIGDILEDANATTTGSFARTDSPFHSVTSIGDVEYKSQRNKVKLYRRNKENCPECIATISRKKGQGWRFNKTKKWDEHELPHFGQLSNIKSDVNGQKSHEKHIKDVLGKWGINHDSIKQLEDG